MKKRDLRRYMDSQRDMGRAYNRRRTRDTPVLPHLSMGERKESGCGVSGAAAFLTMILGVGGIVAVIILLIQVLRGPLT